MRTLEEWEAFLVKVHDGGFLEPLGSGGDAGDLDLRALGHPPLEEEFEVGIDLSANGGLGLEWTSDRDRHEVHSVVPGKGIDAWNRAQPSKAVRPGDRVVRANGKSLAKEVEAALGGRFNVKITFKRGGIDACGLQRWLAEKGYGEARRPLEEAAEGLRSALHGVSASVGFRGLESLGRKELYTYQVLLSEYEHNVADSLKYCLDKVRSAEQEAGGLYGLGLGEPHAAAGPATEAAASEEAPQRTTPEDFQWAHGPEIERRLREIRLPGLGLMTGAQLLERTAWGLRRLLGKAPDGRDVEVVEVPWEAAPEYAELTELLTNRLEALQQLALSPHFPDYWGCDYSSTSGVALHFLQRKRGMSLRQLVQDGGPLDENEPLLVYWAREILKGLRDYLYQCCQELTDDVTLGHVYVDMEGTQVLLQGLPFGERRGGLQGDLPEYAPRCRWRNTFEATEARLVTMFGELLLELLCGEQARDEPGRRLRSVSPEMRVLLSHALNARDSLDHRLGLYPTGRPDRAEAHAEADAASPHEVEALERMAVGLAGGLVAAGLDEYASAEELGAWWTQRRSPHRAVVLPNAERSADAGGAELPEDWGAAPPALLEGGDETPELHWEPNKDKSGVTLQQLLDHPLFAPTDGEDIRTVMEAWELFYSRRQAGRQTPAEQRQRIERYLDGTARRGAEGGVS